MIYKQETLGLKEGIGLVLVATTARITLTSFSGVLSRNGQGGWLQLLINSLMGMVVLIIVYRVYKMSGCKGDLIHLHQRVFGRFWGNLVSFYLWLALLANTVLLLRLYAECTIITSLPQLDLEVAVWLYIISSAISVHFGIAGMARATRIFMPILMVAVLAIAFYLYPFYIPYRIFPWLGTGLNVSILEGITGVAYNTGALAPFVIAHTFSNIKTAYQASIIGSVLSMILKIFLFFIYLLAFGVEIGSEKVLPLYELARLIYLSRYFQNIEALIILVWVVLGILAIAINFYMTLYFFCRLFKLEDAKSGLFLMTLIIGSLALLPHDLMQAVEMDRTFILRSALFTYLLPVLLFVVQYWRKKRSQSWAG